MQSYNIIPLSFLHFYVISFAVSDFFTPAKSPNPPNSPNLTNLTNLTNLPSFLETGDRACK